MNDEITKKDIFFSIYFWLVTYSLALGVFILAGIDGRPLIFATNICLIFVICGGPIKTPLDLKKDFISFLIFIKSLKFRL